MTTFCGLKRVGTHRKISCAARGASRDLCRRYHRVSARNIVLSRWTRARFAVNDARAEHGA